MRNLTFKGYITQQVKNHSDGNTISIHKLAKEAATSNPELMAPLLLYAGISKKSKLLLSAAKKVNIEDKYLDIFKRYLSDISEDTLSTTVSQLPDEFTAIYKKYLDAKAKNKADNLSKDYYKKEILKIAKKHNLSICAVAKRTGLKRGNSYRFFSKNQYDCLSVNSLKRALELLEQEYPRKKGA